MKPLTQPAKTYRNESGNATKNSGTKMTTAEQNFCLLQEIEANRRFLLMAYERNPELLESAEPRIMRLFDSKVACGSNEVVTNCDYLTKGNL